MGSDYHWFLQNTFRCQVDRLYQDPHCSYARDRIWLCRLLTTLAIGQSYVSDSPLVISFDGSYNHTGDTDVRSGVTDAEIKKSTTPPGTEYFEQALALLHIPYEEPRIEHVEVLNLIVSDTTSACMRLPIPSYPAKESRWLISPIVLLLLLSKS
jgi:proline utilization trans-activator